MNNLDNKMIIICCGELGKTPHKCCLMSRNNSIVSWSHALKKYPWPWYSYIIHFFSSPNSKDIRKSLTLQNCFSKVQENLGCASFRSSSSSLMLLRSCLAFNTTSLIQETNLLQTFTRPKTNTTKVNKKNGWKTILSF